MSLLTVPTRKKQFNNYSTYMTTTDIIILRFFSSTLLLLFLRGNFQRSSKRKDEGANKMVEYQGWLVEIKLPLKFMNFLMFWRLRNEVIIINEQMSFHEVLFYPSAFDRLHCHLQKATNTRKLQWVQLFNFWLHLTSYYILN